MALWRCYAVTFIGIVQLCQCDALCNQHDYAPGHMCQTFKWLFVPVVWGLLLLFFCVAIQYWRRNFMNTKTDHYMQIPNKKQHGFAGQVLSLAGPPSDVTVPGVPPTYSASPYPTPSYSTSTVATTSFSSIPPQDNRGYTQQYSAAKA